MLDFTNAKNASISMVKRGDGFDRYGVANLETVFSGIPARLERSTTTTRSADGDVVDIDATLYLEPSVDLSPRDVVTVDNPEQDQYIVYDVSEWLDILGKVIFRSYRLQQKSKI